MNNYEKKRVIQLDEQTWRIIDGFGKGTVYSYLLAGNEQAIVIDTGLGFVDLKHVTDELTSLPVSVVNTHGHLDHISHNYQYSTTYLNPADEVVFLEHSSRDTRLMLLTEVLTEAKLPAWVLKLPMIRKRVEKFTNIPPMNNRKPLADGQKLDLGGRTIEVISTPGHTPGSICLLDVEQRQLFSGDTICAEVILLMLDHSCSVQTFKESMEHVKSFSKRFDRIWPAHHEAPLDHSWMDEYIQCADQIMSGQANAVEVSSPFGKALDAKFGRIKITYKEDRIFKKDSKKNNPSK